MVSKPELCAILDRLGAPRVRRASDPRWRPPPSPWSPDRLVAAQVLASMSVYAEHLGPEIALVLSSEKLPV